MVSTPEIAEIEPGSAVPYGPNSVKLELEPAATRSDLRVE
jgi:hypothetical protein